MGSFLLDLFEWCKAITSGAPAVRRAVISRHKSNCCRAEFSSSAFENRIAVSITTTHFNWVTIAITSGLANDRIGPSLIVRHRNNFSSLGIPNFLHRPLNGRPLVSGIKYSTGTILGTLNCPKKALPVVNAFARLNPMNVLPCPGNAPKNPNPSGKKFSTTQVTPPSGSSPIVLKQERGSTVGSADTTLVIASFSLAIAGAISIINRSPPKPLTGFLPVISAGHSNDVSV